MPATWHWPQQVPTTQPWRRGPAADAAAARGGHSAAAELIDLSIGLGGDTPLRRMRAAEMHFRAGDLNEADARIGPVIDTLPPGALRAISLLLRGAVYGYRDGVAAPSTF